MALFCSQSAADPFRFLIRADPPSIPANGRSTTTISIDISSAPNAGALNGTTVNFVTTLGVIDPVASISRNWARATLRSGTIPGIARVTAIIGPSWEQVEVRFLPTIAAEVVRVRSVRVSGENVVFYPAHNLIVASGKARVRFRRLQVESDVRLQYDIKEQYLVAEAQPGENYLQVTNGKVTLVGDRLKYDFQSLRGLLLRLNPEPAQIEFSGDPLDVIEQQPSAENGAERSASRFNSMTFPDVEFTQGTAVLAREVVVYPEDRIKFRRARFYIDGQRAMSLPLHVLRLDSNAFTSYGIMGERVFNFNTSDGFGLDFPFYYRVSSTGQGAIRLRHAGGASFSANAPGWTLALQEEYALNEAGSGTLLVDKLTRADWGVQLNYAQDFSDQRYGYLYIASPEHKDVFARVSLGKDSANSSVGLEILSNLLGDVGSSYSASVYWQQQPRELGRTAIYFSPSAQVSYDTDPEAEHSRIVSQSLEVPMYLPQWKLAPKTILTASLCPQVYRDNAGTGGAGIGATASLTQMLPRDTNLTLSYTRSPGGFLSAGSGSTQYIAASLRSPLWKSAQFSATANYNLNDASFFGSGTVDLQLRSSWRCALTTSYQRFADDRLLDHDITLSRKLGRPQLESTVGWSKSRGSIYFQISTAYQ